MALLLPMWKVMQLHFALVSSSVKWKQIHHIVIMRLNELIFVQYVGYGDHLGTVDVFVNQVLHIHAIGAQWQGYY